MLLPKAYVECDEWQRQSDLLTEGAEGAAETERIYSRYTRGVQPISDGEMQRYTKWIGLAAVGAQVGAVGGTA